MFTKKICFC